MKTTIILLSLIAGLSCQRKVDQVPDLSGVWTMDLQLGIGICDETLLEDEEGISPTFKFNSDGSLTFVTDPVESDLNNKTYFTNTYTLTDNILSIKVTYDDKEFDEQIFFEARLEYDAGNSSFSGAYTFKSSDGSECANQLEIRK